MITKSMLRNLSKWLDERLGAGRGAMYAVMGCLIGLLVTPIVAQKLGGGWLYLLIPLGAILGSLGMVYLALVVSAAVDFTFSWFSKLYESLPEGDEPVSDEESEILKQRKKLEEVRKKNNWRA